MHNFTVLHKLSEDYIYGNFVQICEEDELGDLSKDQFVKFLNSEYLCVDSEQQVIIFPLCQMYLCKIYLYLFRFSVQL